MKQEDLRVMFTKVFKECEHHALWYFLTPSVSSAMKTPENTKSEPNDVEAANEGNNHMHCCE
jgi:hypothetical protein